MAVWFSGLLVLAIYQFNAALAASSRNVSMLEKNAVAINEKMQNMTVEDAIQVLHKKTDTPAGFVALLQDKLTNAPQMPRKHHHSSKLRGRSALAQQHKSLDPSGYDDVGGAEAALDSMIEEAESGLDTEEETCVIDHGRLTDAVKDARQSIYEANEAAAYARSYVLLWEAVIQHINLELADLQPALRKHKSQCVHDLKTISEELDLVHQDIQAMDKVLEMSECSEETTTGTAFLQCCSTTSGNKTVLMHASKGPFSKFKSNAAKDAVKKAFRVVKHPHHHPHGKISLLQESQTTSFLLLHSASQKNHKDEPLIEERAPLDTPQLCPDESRSRCSISESGDCSGIRASFIDVHGEIVGKKDALESEQDSTEEECDHTTQILEDQITDFEDGLRYVMALRADGQAYMQEQMGESSLQQQHLRDLEAQIHAQFYTCKVLYGEISCKPDEAEDPGTCAVNIDAYLTEICGLKTIRLELRKVEGEDTVFMSDVTDCTVGEWIPEECDKSCGGGYRVKNRRIITPPSHGAQCPPTQVREPCNTQPCPINCVMEAWEGWSGCSASCGGGLMSRTRSIKIHDESHGTPCLQTLQTMSCNAETCDPNCVLEEWSEWCDCNVKCGGGSQRSFRAVKTPATSEGTCAHEESEDRYAERPCNTQSCEDSEGLTDTNPLLECRSNIDVILVLDASVEIGADGWNATKEFAKTLVDSFETGARGVELAVMTYSGPDMFQQNEQCIGEVELPEDFNTAEVCRMNWVSHFTVQKEDVIEAIDAAPGPAGSRLTSLALEWAKEEISNGRESKPTTVILVTGGAPVDGAAAMRQVSHIREHARFMAALVGAPHGWISSVRDVVSLPKDNNLVLVKDYASLPKPATVNEILSNLCPDVVRKQCDYNVGPQGVGCPWGPRKGSSCGDANQLFIGQNGKRFTRVQPVEGEDLIDTAIRLCGPVCDADPTCGGFNLKNNKCFYRAEATSQGVCEGVQGSSNGNPVCITRADHQCTVLS